MGYVLAIFWAAIFSMLFVVHMVEDEYNVGYDSIQMIEECQKTLPRNVECVIVAVPENETEDNE